MPDSVRPYIVAAYIPCRSCGEPCVVLERFADNPPDDVLDRHPFQATCSNCGESQARVGRDAFRRTIVEWRLAQTTP